MFEKLGIKFEGKVDTVALSAYFVGALALAGIIVYGINLYTYITYGV